MSDHAYRVDPRLYQIIVLAGLLLYGSRASIRVSPARAALILASALAAQLPCTRLWKLERFDPKSPLISGLSLCLLLRTNSIALLFLAAMVTILSKFVLLAGGKHLFNPTTSGLVSMMIVTGQVWVSPGQWGNAALFGALMACLGGLVVNRATRTDATLAFLAVYGGLLFGHRCGWGSRSAYRFTGSRAVPCSSSRSS